MTEKAELSQQRIMCVCALLLLIAITVLIFFNNAVEQVLYTTVQETLDEVAVQQQLVINMEITAAKNTVVSIAESLSELGFQQSRIREYLVHQIENYTYEELAFISINGFTTSAYGKTYDIDITPHLKNTHRRQATVSKPYTSMFSENRVIDIAAPVYDGKNLAGFVIAKYSFAILTLNLNNIIQGNGYALVSSGFENPIFATSQNYKTLSSLKDVKLGNDESIENVMKTIKMKRDGSFSFEEYSKNFIAIYKTLDVNDWYLILVLDGDKATAQTKVLANIIAIVSIAVFILLSFFLWYALHSKVESIRKIEKVAYYDELTGLPNLTKFKLLVAETLKKHPNDEFAIIKIDIDNFKAINEMFNFEVGNQVLHAFSKTSQLVKEKTFLLARITGDEFIMFAGNGFLENLDEMTYFYEEYFKNTIPSFDSYHLQFNYGRYYIKPGESDVNDIINKTTMAHAIAKTKKGKAIWNYDNKYKEQVLQIADITNKMRKALYTKEFVPFLQPKYSLKTKKVVGAEALIRWITPERTVILPSIFIPLFERNGFIVEIDMYVLKSVCNTIKTWLENGHECVPVSINISRVHLENENFIEQIIKIVDSVGIPHHYIELEITESIVLENEDMLEKHLENLHNKGFLISIDDFGSGYSSLGLLKNFKVNTIKLDRSFFNITNENSRGEIVIEGIINLAKSLNIHVVAEGIENSEQVSLLKRVSCDTIQGFYFDKAIPIEDFTQKYIQT